MTCRPFLGLAVLAACGGPTSTAPAPLPAPPPAASVPSVASAHAPAPAPEVVPASVVGEAVKMHPVAEISDLHGLTMTNSDLELKVGHNPGGGVTGSFWYVPWKDGRVDLERQTDAIMAASTTAATYEIFGRRPSYFYHQFSGFRSAPVDGYFELTADGKWKPLSLSAQDGFVGAAISAWSKGRLLEWRAVVGMGALHAEAILPRLRVVRGSPKKAPVLPTEMAEKLERHGFRTTTFMAFPDGGVLAVGRPPDSTGFSTVYWKDEHSAPLWIRNDSFEGAGEEELYLLGGTSTADARLMADGVLMGFAVDGWKRLAEPPEDEPPDIWFGEPLLHPVKDRMFVRRAADDPWHPLDGVWVGHDTVVDEAGVVWSAQEGVLLSSEPVEAPVEVTRGDWDESRKKLGLSTHWPQF